MPTSRTFTFSWEASVGPDLTLTHFGNAVVKLASPGLCALCSKATIRLAALKENRDRELSTTWIPLTVDTGRETSEPWDDDVKMLRPTAGEIESGAEAGCPLCGFWVKEFKGGERWPDREDRVIQFNYRVPFLTNSVVNAEASLLEVLSGEWQVDPFARERETGVEIVPGEDHGLGEVGGYRSKELGVGGDLILPNEDALCQRNVDRILEWSETCVSSHTACRVGSPDFIPTRLLSVGTSSSPSLRLVSPTQRVRYLCLSYCWGVADIKAEVFPTTSANMERRYAGWGGEDLPRTVQDMVRICRALGVEHCWIDSLCILQDDTADWEVESARMQDVYANAYITVVATSSPSVHEGIGLRRTRLHRVELSTVVAGQPETLSPLVLYSPQIIPWAITKAPLDSRGWALQERLLSARMLFMYSKSKYTQDARLHFYCRTAQGSDGAMFPPLRPIPWMHRRTDAEGTGEGEAGASPPTQRELHQRWYGVIQHEYWRRKLSNPHDRLPAISGLASRMETLLGDDQYLAGLWRNDLAHGLLWSRKTSGVSEVATGPWRAPSWSWASRHLSDHKYNTDDIVWKYDWGVPQITVAESTMVPAGKDPHGRLVGGRLVLFGRLLDGDEVRRHRWHGEVDEEMVQRAVHYSSEGEEEETRSQLKFDDFGGRGLLDGDKADRVKCLVTMTKFREDEEEDEHYGLILLRAARVGDDKEMLNERLCGRAERPVFEEGVVPLDVYVRVGIFLLKHRDGKGCGLRMDVACEYVLML